MAATKLEGRTLSEGIIVQAHEIHGFPNLLSHLFLAKALIAGTKSDILKDCFRENLVLGILEHHTHLLAGILGLSTLRADIHLINGGRALIRLQKSVQMLHQGGFTATSMTNDGHNLALINLQGHILQRQAFEGGGLRICMINMR